MPKKKPRVTLEDIESAPTIRARYDRHSLWHPKEDAEWEAGSIQKLEAHLEEYIESTLKEALNTDKHDKSDFNPLALRISPCGAFPKYPFTRWVTAGSIYDIDVQVNVSMRPKRQAKKR